MNDISLGISPCPNDTFMFYQLLHKSEWAEKLKANLTIADVEELNKLCLSESIDVSKVSFHVLGKLREKYFLLNSGSALGRGCGPLIICSEKNLQLSGKTIAVPGLNTTAYLLLKCYAPDDIEIKEMLFSDIMPAVKNGDVDAGLIIHESRFTYRDEGLELIADLGEWWETYSGLPIPLGGIIAKRSLPTELIKKIDTALKYSVTSALKSNWQTNDDMMKFILSNSQEILPEVLNSHIRTYVNDESIDLSMEGRKGIEKLFSVAEERGFIPKCDLPLFAPK
ncbi:MAG: 1,4-dihydroxy-6-naphthoate synthase [Lentisphaeraceae bacterium]|nr:1,4-dihydroxy-6-naphthoate synthase [Lentisphaeraceae bacterium]